MKVLEPQSAALSNAEVLNHLTNLATTRRLEADGGPIELKSPNFETVVKELTAYLNPPLPSSHHGRDHGHNHSHGHSNRRGSPAPEAPQSNPSPLPRYAEAYDSYAIEKAMQRLHPFGLTRAELLMVLNLRPTSGARLDAIVEEMDARLTDEQQGQVLQIVQEALSRDGKGGL